MYFTPPPPQSIYANYKSTRYVDTDPTNDWGVVKSRGIPAGVMLNQTGEWNGPIRGK